MRHEGALVMPRSVSSSDWVVVTERSSAGEAETAPPAGRRAPARHSVTERGSSAAAPLVRQRRLRRVACPSVSSPREPRGVAPTAGRMSRRLPSSIGPRSTGSSWPSFSLPLAPLLQSRKPEIRGGSTGSSWRSFLLTFQIYWFFVAQLLFAVSAIVAVEEAGGSWRTCWLFVAPLPSHVPDLLVLRGAAPLYHVRHRCSQRSRRVVRT